MKQDGEAIHYRFGPLERRGLVAGLRGGQIALLSFAGLLDVVVLRHTPSLTGVFVALVVLVVAVGLATWPVAGRTAEEWAPDAVRHAGTSLARRARSRSAPFASLEVLTVDGGDDRLCAVVHDSAIRTYTAIMSVQGDGFVLLDSSQRAERVASWAGVLASACRQGSAAHRLQWVARCIPADAAALRRYVDEGSVLERSATAQRSYRSLLDAETAGSRRHEVLVAVTVSAARAARALRAAGGGHRGGCALVVREAAWMRRQLADAGFVAGELLDERQLADAVRRSFHPRSSPAGLRPTAWPWPMAVEANWSQARADGTWHATYWIAEWPRRDVGPDFLGPLLLSDVRCSVGVVMEPVGALEAARRIEQARTARIADAELRRRGGFLESARWHRQEEVLVQREQELADGHAQYRFTGYVTVTAEDPDALEDACARTEQAAGRSGLELRRCYGDQDRAFACTLPLGRGLA